MFNQVTLLGRVGKIETKPLQSGSQVSNLSLVTTKKLIKDGVSEDKATWHNISLFGKISEIVEQYVHVGDLLFVQGEVENKKYIGKDGVERTGSFIIGQQIKLMPSSRHKVTEKPVEDSGFNDEIPF